MNLEHLSPEDLASLKQQLGIGPNSGRVTDVDPPRPRQLHDLRLLPTATDARPLFIPSAEAPRDGRDLTKTTPYPKLMFHKDTGEEITVISSADERQHSDLYDLMPKAGVVLEPMDALKLELDSFSDEDQKLIINAQQQTRIAAMQAKLAGLSEEKLAALLAAAEGGEKKSKRKSA